MLAPMSELETADNGVYQLGVKSLGLWPEIIRQLNETYGEKVFFQNNGTLVVSHPQDKGSLKHFVSILKCKLGNDFDEYCQSVSLDVYEPELHNFSEGMLLNIEAQLDSHQLLAAMHRVIKTKGKWENQKVDVISSQSLSLSNGCRRPYDWIFDCRGLAAHKSIDGLHGVRGERILVHAPQVNFNHMVRLMHPRYRLYVAPRENNNYIIGATEIESGDSGPISVRSTLELLSAAFSLHSGFAEARILDMRTGLRPTRLDHQPFVETKFGLTVINGFYRHGYLIAPAVIDSALSEFLALTDSNKNNDLLDEEINVTKEACYESDF
jgi:glycine oxidase